MTASQESFNSLVARAIKENGSSGNKPVIEKELLHYDILFVKLGSKIGVRVTKTTHHNA